MEKDDRAGGRLDRGIELRDGRRWDRHKEDDEHMGKKTNQVVSKFIKFNILLSSYNSLFKEYEEEE